MSKHSTGACRATFTIVSSRTIRWATNRSTPASAASGTWSRSALPQSTNTSTITAATSALSCDLLPDSTTTAVRGGAGVDRKGSQESGDEITYAQAEKVAINVRRAVSWTPERICHRCRLHHNHERDD